MIDISLPQLVASDLIADDELVIYKLLWSYQLEYSEVRDGDGDIVES